MALTPDVWRVRAHGALSTRPTLLAVAAAAYLIGLQPALFLALVGWVIGRDRHLLATDRDRRLEVFRDNWSRRFHRELYTTEGRLRRPLLALPS